MPKKYGAAAQEPTQEDDLLFVDDTTKIHLQQVIGTVLYYTRAVDLTLLPAPSLLASNQPWATERTIKKMDQMLD